MSKIPKYSEKIEPDDFAEISLETCRWSHDGKPISECHHPECQKYKKRMQAVLNDDDDDDDYL